MKVSYPDPDTLQLTQSPWPAVVAMVVFVALLGLLARYVVITGQATPGMVAAFAPIALLMLVWPFTVRRSTFRFDRRRGEVDWQHRSLFGGQFGTLRLGDIKAAEVQSQFSRREDAYHRICLILHGGNVLPLTPDFPAGPVERLQRVADEINAFLDADAVARRGRAS